MNTDRIYSRISVFDKCRCSFLSLWPFSIVDLQLLGALIFFPNRCTLTLFCTWWGLNLELGFWHQQIFEGSSRVSRRFLRSPYFSSNHFSYYATKRDWYGKLFWGLLKRRGPTRGTRHPQVSCSLGNRLTIGRRARKDRNLLPQGEGRGRGSTV